MNEHYRPQPGTPMENLDTPCLVIDMDALDNNMDVIADCYEGRSSKLRGHAKNHKTPAIAHRQIRRGGTVGGVCAAKVSEAEVMVHGGIPSVFITSEIVEPMKIERLCSLAGQAEMMVACAEVIKIERPGRGDGARWLGPFASWGAEIPPGPPLRKGRSAPEDGAWFLYLNTAKHSLALDLKSPAGRDLVLELASKADILVENFAPGGMDRLGLPYLELQKINPALVVTSISNFGQTGPYRDWKATELNLYAMGGLMNITGEPDQEPLKEGMPLAQLGAGQNAFAATMAALMYAEETGEGQQVDVSIAEYATNILENALMQYSYSGQEYSRVGNRGYGRAAWGIYPCRDGHVGIIAGPDHRWPEVAKIMEREELADPRFTSRAGRLEHADEVDAYMLPWLVANDKVDIFKAGQESGLGFSFVATIKDILEMEQLLNRNYFVELDHPVAGRLNYPGAPIMPESGIDAWVFRRAPLLGEHTSWALSSWLGYSELQVAGLVDQGVTAFNEGV